MKRDAHAQACYANNHGYSRHDHEADQEKKSEGRGVAAHLAIKGTQGERAQGERAGIPAWHPAVARRKTSFGHILKGLL